MHHAARRPPGIESRRSLTSKWFSLVTPALLCILSWGCHSSQTHKPSPNNRRPDLVILQGSTISSQVQSFYAQDLLEARTESTGVLSKCYQAALAQFRSKQGRAPVGDLEIAVAVTDWVSSHLRHPAFFPEDPSLPRLYPQRPSVTYDTFNWDPVKILAFTLSFDPNIPESWPSPLCSQQNYAVAGILNHAGLHARICDVEGHTGLEYFSWDRHQWIWCDSTFNEHFVLAEPNGELRPLGVRELQSLTLHGGIDKVRTIKHGHPSDLYAANSYLRLHPHGFRRFAATMYMRMLNGKGAQLRRYHDLVVCPPIPIDYKPLANEVVDLQKDPSSNGFFLWPRLPDPSFVDIQLDALELITHPFADSHTIQFQVRTFLPYAKKIQVRTNKGPWTDLATLDPTSPLPQNSALIQRPRTPGEIAVRALDNVGNASCPVVFRIHESH